MYIVLNWLINKFRKTKSSPNFDGAAYKIHEEKAYPGAYDTVAYGFCYMAFN